MRDSFSPLNASAPLVVHGSRHASLRRLSTSLRRLSRYASGALAKPRSWWRWPLSKTRFVRLQFCDGGAWEEAETCTSQRSKPNAGNSLRRARARHPPPTCLSCVELHFMLYHLHSKDGAWIAFQWVVVCKNWKLTTPYANRATSYACMDTNLNKTTLAPPTPPTHLTNTCQYK